MKTKGPAENLILPNLVISPTDVSRLRRELEALDDYLEQARLRQPNQTSRLPRTSPLFEELGLINKLDFNQAADRQKTARFLDFMKTSAPVVHISFSADPSAAFLAKLLTWLRQNIHPLLLVRVGLQPTIAAGCVIRTNSHVFDFSLRRHLLESRPMLIQSIQQKTTKGHTA